MAKILRIESTGKRGGKVAVCACDHCGNEMIKRYWSGMEEKRRFCDKACQDAYSAGRKLGKRKERPDIMVDDFMIRYSSLKLR